MSPKKYFSTPYCLQIVRVLNEYIRNLCRNTNQININQNKNKRFILIRKTEQYYNAFIDYIFWKFMLKIERILVCVRPQETKDNIFGNNKMRAR